VNVEKINKTVKVDLKEGFKKILPEIFEDNKINFEKLKALLSGEIIEKEDDRFYFNWAGKSNVFKFIQASAYGTLKPDKEKSIDFDKTENVVIVGENLETLKLLLKPYFGKVKMIYIDPPYNTGKDRIYKDNFEEPLKDYLEKTGQIDSEGNKLTTNTEASGRYHSDWLDFMYPRLFLARSLLKEDGVIFISIDDHEVHHLRMIMDEIFGEDNFVANLKWKKKKQPSFLHNQVSSITEYVVVFAKDIQQLSKLSLKKIAGDTKPLFNSSNNESIKILPKGIRANFEKGIINKGKIQIRTMTIEYLDDVIVENGRTLNEFRLKGRFRDTQDNINDYAKKDLIFITSNYALRRDVSEEEKLKQKMITDLLLDWGQNQDAFDELYKIFNGKIPFDNPKPTLLIKNLAKSSTTINDIILDFFAGSGSTGHAVWDSNKEDGGNRKFILVQLDEPVDEKSETGKNALSLGLKTVADICIERLRRVSEKYKNGITSSLAKSEARNDKINNNQDFGFKVFRVDKSNFNLKDEFEIKAGEDVEELKKKYLEWLGIWIDEPLVSNWQKIDVVYEIILKEGLNLNSKIEKVRIKNNNFYYVKDAGKSLDFYISLDEKIDNETIEEIRTTKYKNKMFVFLDKALTDDDKINLTSFVRLKVI